MEKHRKDSNEWIKELEEKNLIITNKKEFKSYIDSYSFFNFVKKYSKPLYEKSKENTKIYKEGSNSKMIISLFNLDRRLSALILEDIFLIERKLSTLIYREIMDKNLSNIPELNENYFYSLSDENFNSIFPFLEKNVFNIHKRNKKGVVYLKTEFFEKKGMKNMKIWDWASELTFGELCDIFFLLSIDSKKNITKLFFKHSNDKKFYLEFQQTINLINYTRNIVCHNRQIYDIKYTMENYRIISLYKKLFCKKIKNIRLYNIVMLIDSFSPQKNNLCSLFKNEIELFSSKTTKDFSDEIKVLMNFE